MKGDRFDLYYSELAMIAIWANISGHCRNVEMLTIDLLGFPSGYLEIYREFLEPSAIRCFLRTDANRNKRTVGILGYGRPSLSVGHPNILHLGRSLQKRPRIPPIGG